MTVMKPSRFRILPHFLRVLGVVALTACAAPPPSAQINDPDEGLNRKVHKFNILLDRKLLRPIATTIVKRGGGPVSQGISNFARNLSAPSHVLNDVLQMRLGHAVENTLRFAINTTVGIGGIFDPAQAAGLAGRETDFGETLHVWGVGEGTYLEAPAFGPTTQRDLSGDIVDVFINPLNFILPSDQARYAALAANASRVVDRGRYAETVDSILYESEDSYAQARLYYLQNRRFALGQTAESLEFEDPYAE